MHFSLRSKYNLEFSTFSRKIVRKEAST
jgi:hypothetical protein